MKKAVVLLAEGFEEIEAITAIDLLRRAGISVTTVGLGSQEIRGARGVVVRTEAQLSGFAEEFDALVLPGGQPGSTNLASSAEVLCLVRRSFSEGKLISAICAAPSVLGKAGILEGKRATCYPGVEEKLTGSITETAPVVVDGTVITSRGVGTAILFALEIVSYLEGRPAAHKVASAILVDFK